MVKLDVSVLCVLRMVFDMRMLKRELLLLVVTQQIFLVLARVRHIMLMVFIGCMPMRLFI